MKKKHIILLSLLFVSFINILFGQKTLPDNRTKNQPILIDDAHAESLKLAELKLTTIPASALITINDLTDKQIKCISRIEKCRDKKLTKINNKLASNKTKLIELQVDANNNENKIKQELNKISKLAICYKKAISKSSNKIKSKLTKNQQLEYDKTHKSSN